MRKISSLIALTALFIVPIFWVYATVVLQKNVVTKDYILARSELKKNIEWADEYIDEFHSFFAEISDDTDELEAILARVQESKTHNFDSDTKIILNYIEKLCLYTLVGNNDTYTPPHNENNGEGETNKGENNEGKNEEENQNTSNHQWKDINEATLLEMETISNTIWAHIASGETITESIGEVITTSSSTDSYLTLGYPNYGDLGLVKGGYIDSYNNEYIITTLQSTTWDYYQVLGYLKKDENTKVAYIIGNYTKPNQYYPESLFVDPLTGNPILSGDEFKVQ